MRWRQCVGHSTRSATTLLTYKGLSAVKQITIEGCAVAGEPEGEGQGSDGQQHKSDGPKEEPEPDDQSNQSTTTAITTSVTSSSVSTSSTPPPPPPPPQTLVLTSDKMVSSLVTITSLVFKRNCFCGS